MLANERAQRLSAEVLTLGCRVNQYESEKMRRDLAHLGFMPFERLSTSHSSSSAEPDVVIINTCAVTSASERKSRKLIRKIARERPGSYVVVTGCFAELEEESIRRVEGVDAVASNDDKGALPAVIAGMRGGRLPSGALSCSDVDAASTVRVRSLLKVQDGCDAYCTYCTVPYVRGAPRSRTIAECVAEAVELTEAGTRELVLTGVHLGRFEDGKETLADLVQAILHAIPVARLPRIRLSSIEAGEVSEELVDLMAGEPRFCSYLHLPLQSGSDPVLARMGRTYKGGDFLALTEHFRRRVPGLSISADVIAGFPGETSADHAATMAVVRTASLNRLHVFPFSAREQAPASRFPDQVPSKVKLTRAAELMTLGEELRDHHLQALVGQFAEVLVESRIQSTSGMETDVSSVGEMHVGLTGGYHKVVLPCSSETMGKLVMAKIDRVDEPGRLRGELAAENSAQNCRAAVL